MIRGVIESRTCLLPMITEDSKAMLRFFAHYRHRVLPHAGGILDQPHFYAEAMEILSARAAELEAERLEKMKREAARHGASPPRSLGVPDGV